MPALKNFVAVDWRAGKDRCYFFFKDENKYSLFDNAQDKVLPGYPRTIDASNWGAFHPHAKNLRFGFTTTERDFPSVDTLHLFYLENNTPMVCSWDQQADKLIKLEQLSASRWSGLGGYFPYIVAGVWWQEVIWPWEENILLFLTSIGEYLRYNTTAGTIEVKPINDSTWPGLAPYKDRMLTAVQFDRDLADDYLYIFLTENKYIKYNIDDDKAEGGLLTVNEHSWPGLLRD